MRLYLEFKPTNFLDFFCVIMKYINDYELFIESENPSNVVRDNLVYFIQEFDCF